MQAEDCELQRRFPHALCKDFDEVRLVAKFKLVAKVRLVAIKRAWVNCGQNWGESGPSLHDREDLRS